MKHCIGQKFNVEIIGSESKFMVYDNEGHSIAAVCIRSFDTERNKDESPIRDHLYHFPSDAIHT